MALVEVDVVDLQAPQRGVDLLVDLTGRQAPVVVGHREVDLRREDVARAVVAGQDLAPRLFRGAAAVHVRGVEEGDAGVERRSRARLRLLASDASGVRQPGAEADLRDLEVAVTQLPCAHGRTLPTTLS